MKFNGTSGVRPTRFRLKGTIPGILYSAAQLIFEPVSAVETRYQAGDDFFGDAPVVLTVSRMHKPLNESPATVSVIDREMIRNSGAREIVDIFRMVPGFIVGFAEGHRPAVTYTGLGHEYSRQMQVLVDGRSVFIPSFGGVPWANLPLSIHDIERVEVIRGPNAVTYGANAFLAVINIITRNAAEDAGGELVVTHDLDHNSTVQDAYARFGRSYGDLAWKISASQEKDDGFDDYFENNSSSETRDSKLLRKLNLRTDFQVNHNQAWSIQLGMNDASLDLGDNTSANPYRQEETVNSYQNIRWDLVNPGVETTFKLMHTRQQVEDGFFASEDIFIADLDFGRTSDRLDLELFQNRSVSEGVTLNYGVNLRRDKVKSSYLFNRSETFEVDSSNLFSGVEWRLPSSTIIDAGIFFEDSDNVDHTETSYRLSLIQPFDVHTLRLVSSSAKRIPILWEQLGDTRIIAEIDPDSPAPYNLLSGVPFTFDQQWLNQGNLQPETIVSNEIGLSSRFAGGQLVSDIKLFRYKIRDHITEVLLDAEVTVPGTDFVVDSDYQTMTNGRSTTVDGLEWFINYSPRASAYRVYGGLSLIDADSFEKRDFRTLDELQASFPDHSAFIGGHFNPAVHHQVSATLYLVDDFSWTNTTHTTHDYQKLDMRYQYTFDPRQDLRLEVIGYNLAEEFADYRRHNLHKKSVLLRLSGNF